MTPEPIVTVNGARLSDGQVATIRVALNFLLMDWEEQTLDNVNANAAFQAHCRNARETLIKMSEKG